MNKEGVIVYIDDDEDDKLIFSEVYSEIKDELAIHNTLKTFSSGKAFLEYAEKQKPEIFLIISDINMPEMNGMELREQVLSTAYAAIPYLLYSTAPPTSVNPATVTRLDIAGVYLKPFSYQDMMQQLKVIIEYWLSTVLLTPNN